MSEPIRFHDPGPLVVGRSLPGGPTTFRFEPLESTNKPLHEIVEHWRCPHGHHGGEPLTVRRYPDLADPALFVDCTYCRITWELPYTAELTRDGRRP